MFTIEIKNGTNSSSGYENNLVFKKQIFLHNCWTSHEFFITPISTLFYDKLDIENVNFIENIQKQKIIKKNMIVLCVYNLLIDYLHTQEQVTNSILNIIHLNEDNINIIN